MRRDLDDVYDRFGGDVLRTVNQGVLHYWNRVDGVDVDLIRDQFDRWAPEEEIVTVDRDTTMSVRADRLSPLATFG